MTSFLKKHPEARKLVWEMMDWRSTVNSYNILSKLNSHIDLFAIL
jgi:hypothetical protein